MPKLKEEVNSSRTISDCCGAPLQAGVHGVYYFSCSKCKKGFPVASNLPKEPKK